MATISEIYNLGKTQLELDFADIDIEKDIPLFLDSTLIAKCNSDFTITCNDLLQDFFSYLIGLLKNNMIENAKQICTRIGEVNETHLGLSKKESRGKGIGPGGTLDIFSRLKNSKAIECGFLENIEDLRIFIEKIDRDKLSDLITNIIRKKLLEYTIEQCELNNIPITRGVPSGYYWNKNTHKWENMYTDRLVVKGTPILLVPKSIISYCDMYTPAKYRQHFILNFLQKENIENETALVKIIKTTKEKYVTKKSIMEHEPKMDKKYILNFTIKHPEIFNNFKNQNKKTNYMNGELLTEISYADVCQHMAEKLKSIPAGTEQASDYHDLMIGIYEFLSYPDLSNPNKEVKIHNGRKRIDIVFSNISEKGYFAVISDKIKMTSPQIIVECKNYKGDPHNPELDQLSGRFSIRRGQIGILSCRTIEKYNKFIESCADTYLDGHGLILPITDDEIIEILKHNEYAHDEFLKVLQEKTNLIISKV
jgi:hypothetical protein